ncbi:MAG: hypothetical protein GY750_19795 [Lentisphaerae bacterium]|nr:hypothetical protein [Lentisphaerota bacterium]MCP4103639.1 hypothetical protein [Lentisphaerota bacterium]
MTDFPAGITANYFFIITGKLQKKLWIVPPSSLVKMLDITCVAVRPAVAEHHTDHIHV